jgi:hypothetical protein
MEYIVDHTLGRCLIINTKVKSSCHCSTTIVPKDDCNFKTSLSAEVKKICGLSIQKYSCNSKSYLQYPTMPDNDINRFVLAAHESYDKHYCFMLSPEVVWMTLLQQISIHVSKNPELCRSKLNIEHNGKSALNITDADVRVCDPESNWCRVITKLSRHITEDVGDEYFNSLMCNFDNTSNMVLEASRIALVDVHKSYYNCQLSANCAIPEIILTGTESDWRKIKRRIHIMRGLGMVYNADRLDEVLTHIIGVYSKTKTPLDDDFWKSFYKYDSRNIESPTVNGWINAFFMYIKDNDNNYIINCLSQTWRVNYSLNISGTPIDRFPASYSITPFNYVINSCGSVRPMKLISGILSASMTNEDPTKNCLIVAPEIGWIVV